MIISEQERSRIKSLYGLLSESVPPEESVLVANKNPFKYDEHRNARKEYSGSLKDGELFYVLDNSYLENIKNEIEKKEKSFLSNLIGKTLRYSVSDFQKNKEYEFMVGNRMGGDEYKTMVCELTKVDDNNRSFLKCKLDNGVVKNFDDCLTIFSTDGIYFDVVRGFGSSYLSFDGVNKLYKNQIGVQKKKTDLVEIPDEYFEIRRIVRQKTNF
jgi:hypothetical protein